MLRSRLCAGSLAFSSLSRNCTSRPGPLTRPFARATMASTADNSHEPSSRAKASPTSSSSDAQASTKDGPTAGKKQSQVVPPLELTALSPTIYIYRPAPLSAAASKKAKEGAPSFLAPLEPRGPATTPRVILLMGWMNAPLRLVTKYAAPYALLFPRATIVVQLSTGVTFIRDRKAHDAGFRHVIDVLKEAKQHAVARSALHDQVRELREDGAQAGLRLDADAQHAHEQAAEEGQGQASTDDTSNEANDVGGGVLVHSFSDGGAFNVTQLLERIKDQDVPPPLAHIMDSSPGRASPRSGSTAITMSLVNRPWLRFVVRSAIYIYLFVLYNCKRIIGAMSWSEKLRRALNNPRKWAWSGTQAASKETQANASSTKLPPRCYLYSRSDALIDYRAVEEHAREAAKSQGLSAPKQVLSLAEDDSSASSAQRQLVAVRRWDGIQHCDIGRADFDGYWSAIRQFLTAVL